MASSLSVSLDAELLADLDRLVADLGRSREQLVGEAVAKFVKDEIAFSEFIAEGERDFENGDYMSHEDFMTELRARYAHKDAA